MSQSFSSQITETVVKEQSIQGGRQIAVNLYYIQNTALYGLCDLVSGQAVNLLECESNNGSTIKDPQDVENINIFLATFKRRWDAARKFNTGAAFKSLESTHPITFPDIQELQRMPNSPIRQLNFLIYALFQSLTGLQASKMQSIIDENMVKAVNLHIEKITDFISVELGTGESQGDGTFNVGERWPEMNHVGNLKDQPQVGQVLYSEHSSGTLPGTPNDVADTASGLIGK